MFESARAKVDRAKELIEGLKSDAWEFDQLHKGAIVIEMNPQKTEYVFVLDSVYHVPRDWPITIGEVLFNLRSALDHVAYELAISHSGPRLDPKVAQASEFPIFSNAADFRDRGRGKIRAIAPDRQALIERMQPLPGRTSRAARTLVDEIPEHLRLLHDLARVERHRLPPLVIQVMTTGSWLSHWPTPELNVGRVGPGSTIATMGYHDEFEPYVSQQPRFSFSPAIEHDGELRTLPGCLDVISLMVKRAMDVLDGSPGYRSVRKELLWIRPSQDL